MTNETHRNSRVLLSRYKMFPKRTYIVSVLVSLLLIAVAVGLIWKIVYSSLVSQPVVKTGVGLIRGIKAEDGDYSMFMGIPYAKVNITNPFGNSMSYPPFQDIFNAHDDKAICPQIEEFNQTLVGSLDCLHLNIYVPTSACATNRLPVLVYIHGGRYEVGFAGRFLYGPKFFMRQSIILITLNYRLGPYGFLCLNIPEAPGNQGFKDQMLALKWVKNNIETFGGDSNRITIAGESSGGQSVDFHVMYGKDHLFDRAIIGGGAQLDSVTITPVNQSIPIKLAEDLGYKTTDIRGALSFLSKQESNAVIASSARLKINYKPCVEKEFLNVESFITAFPKSGDLLNVRRIPVMITQSSNEYYHRIANADFDSEKYNTTFKDQINQYFDIDDKHINIVEMYVRNFYIRDKKIGNAVKQQIINFFSDLFQNYPMKKKIDQYLNSEAKNIFYGMFSYAGRRNYMKIQFKVDINSTGAAHGDELGYLFDVSFLREPVTTNDQLMIDRITKLWANFITYGNPTPVTTELLPVKWTPVTKEVRTYLNVDVEMRLGVMPFRERMAFWENFENFVRNGNIEELNDNYTLNI